MLRNENFEQSRGARKQGMTVGAFFMAALALAALTAGGCTTQGKLLDIQDEKQFDQVVVMGKGPVLVDFYKDSCPTCVVQEATLEEIVDDYQGRVRFVRFKIRECNMQGTSKMLMDRYNLFWVPTVMLFVDGQEKQRWVFNHMAMEFRPALDAAAAGKAIPAAVGASPNAFGQPIVAGPNGQNQCTKDQGCPIR